MEIKKELVKREIAGDIILIPVGKTVYENNGLFVLNELGNFIWDLLPDAPDAQAICQAVLDNYEVSEEEARSDVEEFLRKLKEMDIL